MQQSQNLQLVAPGVFYSGVDDHYTTLFENLWPLPNGVSYNSYLVVGDKATALIDGVHIESLPELFDLIGRRQIDYLIVNHMEPDHSSSLPVLLKAFPNMKIVGNRQTIAMLQGFYGINNQDRIIQIKDLDCISLGSATLRFILTPMVHWPETMMTYLEEQQVLFTGDAFGGFGSLSGNALASQADLSVFIPEVYRYYSNIVAKYGKNVLNAIKKLNDISINTICPTHGLVWDSPKASLIIDLYSKLASWQAEPGTVIVTGTMYGTTERIADYLSRRITELKGEPVKQYRVSFDNLSYILADICRYRDIIIGSATYSMDILPPVDALLKAISIRDPQQRRFAFFSSYTWAPSVALRRFEDFASSCNLTTIGSAQMKQGMLSDAIADLDKIVDTLTK